MPHYDDPSWPPQSSFPSWQHPSPPNHHLSLAPSEGYRSSPPPSSLSAPSSRPPPPSSYSPQVGWNYPFLTPPPHVTTTPTSLTQSHSRAPPSYPPVPASMRTSLSTSTSTPLEMTHSVPSWQYSFPQGLNSYNGYSPPPPPPSLPSTPSVPPHHQPASSPRSQAPSAAPPAPYNLHLSTSLGYPSPGYPSPSTDHPRNSFHYYPPRPQLAPSPRMGMSTSLTSASGLEVNTPSSSPSSSNLSTGSSGARYATIPGVPAQATI
eukprot:TRINITY_DN376_c0_g2_i2.p1 TRINITY_DN376_c0_g2~~TRINITY_DN376_c0_g2_i2.p1  ORF type:complete len:263 (+),score=70.41 TRINITY_DN376_c0_g2_i2:504-1292(+)